jgi:cytochrome c553
VITGDITDMSKDIFYGYSSKGEHIVKYAPDGEENATTRAVGAVVTAKSTPYGSIGLNMIEKKLGKSYVVKCAPCHDDYANGVIGPSLLDKDDKQIYQMITKYRKNEEKNTLMQRFVNKMTDEEIREIAVRIKEFNDEVKRSGL